MKKCPSCDRTYPESETFCETDGVALIKADPAFVERRGQGGLEPSVECPVCGGRAEPGEVICNFCGARLTAEPPSPSRPQTRPTPSRTAITPPSQRLSGKMTAQIPNEEPEPEQDDGGSRFGVIGYAIAALVALIGGAWLALHLSSRQAAKQEAAASPSAAVSPAPVSGPVVALANNIPLQITGESASAPERSADAVRQTFDDRKNSLMDTYQHALGADASLSDAMMVRVKIMPDGTVAGAAVRTSTTPNPGLDAEVVKDISAWSFARFGGGQVEADYPIIFARDASEQANLESALNTKLASLSPNEAPEFGASVAASASPSPAIAAVPSQSAPAPAVTPAPVAHARPPKHVASAPKPKPTPGLRERVQTALKSDRRLGRVQFYTNPGGGVVLFGKVFDEKNKAVAESVVRSVPGVTSVADNLTTDTGNWVEQQAQVQSQLANAGLGKVNVRIIGRDAFLSGEVKTDAEKDRAVTITEGAAPVIVRENLITVAPGSVFGF